MIDEELLYCAKEAIKNSYAPYSNFKVGASLLTASGIYTGANIENISYSATMCAERVAVFNAVSNGEMEFEAICVYHNGDKLPYPCGSCLQVLSEFVVNDDFTVYVANDYEVKEYTLQELLPIKFEGDLDV